MRYLDTSLLVAIVTPEAATERAEAWLASSHEQIALSDWTTPEFAAALSIKIRERKLDVARRDAAMRYLENLKARTAVVFPVDASHFSAAAVYCQREDLGLRAPDALHIAVAVSHSARVCTLDRGQAAAALALGVSTELV